MPREGKVCSQLRWGMFGLGGCTKDLQEASGRKPRPGDPEVASGGPADSRRVNRGLMGPQAIVIGP